MRAYPSINIIFFSIPCSFILKYHILIDMFLK